MNNSLLGNFQKATSGSAWIALTMREIVSRKKWDLGLYCAAVLPDIALLPFSTLWKLANESNKINDWP